MSAGQVVTILNDKENFNVVHPLHSQWTLYWDGASRQAREVDWLSALQVVCTFGTVEEFWAMFAHLQTPSSIFSTNNSFYLFRAGIKPAWEDPANARGGKWVIQFSQNPFAHAIDQIWSNLSLAAIGECLDIPYDKPGQITSKDVPFRDLINGVVVSSKKNFWRIQVWTRDTLSGPNRDSVLAIGYHLRHDVLGPLGNGNIDLEFSAHASDTRPEKFRF